jgi:uncharacterized protein YycO
MPTRPGDFILTHRKQLASDVIALGQRTRYRGARATSAHWSHAALLVGTKGELIEALTKGVCETTLERYRDIEYHVVSVLDTTEDRERACRFAQTLLGREYGWTEIASLSLSVLTGMRLSIGVEDQVICSALVAMALEHAGLDLPREGARCMPADLAFMFGVKP